jgi:hypothetical protein
MSSKDLTEALRALTEQANGADSGPPAMKSRGAAAAVKSSALLAGGATGSSDFTLKGEKTVTSTDGIFTFYFPETLEKVIGGKTVKIGAITATTP